MVASPQEPSSYYPSVSQRSDEAGRIVVTFAVDEDGKAVAPFSIDAEQSFVVHRDQFLRQSPSHELYPRLTEAAKAYLRSVRFATGVQYKKSLTASFAFELKSCGLLKYSGHSDYNINICAGLGGCSLSRANSQDTGNLSYDGLNPPTTIGELLSSIKTIAHRRLWDRDDFYTREGLERLFGTQAKIDVKTEPEETLNAKFFGLKSLLKPQRQSGLPGVAIYARKHLKRPPFPEIPGSSQLWNYNTKRSFQMTFDGTAQGLDFKSVVAVFGDGWRQDVQAENERFEAFTREVFNPPFPQASGYMGNAIIAYSLGSPTDCQETSLSFGPTGVLTEIDSRTAYPEPYITFP